MGALPFNDVEILHFFASLTRVICLFLLLPIFGENAVPPLVKVFLALTMNMVVFPVASASGSAHLVPFLSSDLGIISLVMKEALIGLTLGFIAKMFFDGMVFAFSHIGMQMGFNMATAYDHQMEVSVPVVSHLIMIMATLLFLAVDGHHLFIRALLQSYEVVAVGEFVLTKSIVAYILETSAQVFWIAVKLSAPMALMIFLINCAFGIIAKAVPQINVLIVSFTVNILAGFIIITLSLPVFGSSMGEVFRLMINRMIHLLNVIA